MKKAVHVLTKGTYEISLTVSSDSIDGTSRTASSTSKTRDIGAESMQGFSPDVGTGSRLRSVGTGFVVGMIGAGGKTGKWVSS